MDKYLTTTQIINLLIPKKSHKEKVSRQFVINLIKIGKLRGKQYGRSWLVKEEDFIQFVEENNYEVRKV